MRTLHKLRYHFTILILIIPSKTTISAQSLPGCPDRCGDVTIPYPFGTKKGCYLSKSYHVNCKTLTIMSSKFKLLEISLEGYMLGFLPMGYRCYNKTRGLIMKSEPRINLGRFSISSSHNLFTTVGCDTRADIKSFNGGSYITGCISMTDCAQLVSGSCLGMGCSQVPIPYDLANFRIHSQSNSGEVGKWSYNNCTYAFLVEKNSYEFLVADIYNIRNRSFPVVLKWSVGNTSCAIAQKNKTTSLCKENSVCQHSPMEYFNQSTHGYNCICAQGYRGNPYLVNGCRGNAFYISTNVKSKQTIVYMIVVTQTGVTIVHVRSGWMVTVKRMVVVVFIQKGINHLQVRSIQFSNSHFHFPFSFSIAVPFSSRATATTVPAATTAATVFALPPSPSRHRRQRRDHPPPPLPPPSRRRHPHRRRGRHRHHRPTTVTEATAITAEATATTAVAPRLPPPPSRPPPAPPRPPRPPPSLPRPPPPPSPRPPPRPPPLPPLL
ncbi:hypothetical protein OSB04_003793 [Centaurea solstitialis]|uniref:Wall-associated receptor kinase galacturonan-binding domain-containing protein n=1 Tax=Centaurea solstitialis TaxID=347529 RepID=A0AA38WNJ0_9ASTR|nr:hypothetical protein OSB04_003793 [Centaurea solstitialis]